MSRGRVTGFAGISFPARDPAALKAWYETHLGIDTTGAYWNFDAGPALFWPVPSDSAGAEQGLVLTLRVTGLDDLVARLRAAGIAVETRSEDWDSPDEIGRFARIIDPEGNTVDLKEPPA